MKEFEFIRELKESLKTENGVLSIGDDAAKIGDMLIAKDILVENVHFLSSTPVDFVIHKLFASNVSDICAMGGVAKYALLGLAIPKDYKFEKELLSSIKKYTGQYNLILIGGDTTGSGRDLFLSLTVTGYAGKNTLLRSGAKPGDILFVSRPLGLSGVSLEKELGKNNITRIDEYRHYMNEPEIVLANILSEKGFATSCIDVSDGLGRDAGHIAEESKVRIIIEAETVPLEHLQEYNINEPLKYFVSSGEEFALLFTVSPDIREDFLKYCTYRRITPVYLGYVTEGSGVFLKHSDFLEDISAKGYEHYI